MATDEVSEERHMVEYSQSPSQDTKVQATGSTKTEAIEEEPSLREITPRRGNKEKEVAEHTPSSSRVRSSVGRIPRWIGKEIMRSTKPQFYVSEEDICDIAKILNKPESPSHEAAPLSFVTTIRN